MTVLTDRRNDTRVSVRVPLRFKLIGLQNAEEQVAESENLSQRGVFMWTEYPLNVGAQVELKLRMPREISGDLAAEVHCTARVVRIVKGEGQSGVGLRIERYHASAERERWAC
jgi:hypothetical protein